MKNISNCKGFTLLELLITMSIILILSSVAIPAYKDYRKKAFDVRALSDLKNITTAQELYYMDNEAYLECRDDSCLNLPGIQTISKGVTVNVTLDGDSYIAKAKHESSDKEFIFDGKTGIIE